MQLFLYKQKQENKERYPVFKILVIQGKMFDLVVESWNPHILCYSNRHLYVEKQDVCDSNEVSVRETFPKRQNRTKMLNQSLGTTFPSFETLP